MPEYCHLHNHTQFSLLDGASDIKGLMAKAVQDGQRAIALTDHGNMFGAFKFVTEARSAGIKPIVGCEFYLVKDRFAKSFSRRLGERDVRHHQLMLAKNAQGYQNLTKLCSLGFIDGLYSDFPRIDKKLIEQYHEGLIATSCCIGAELPQLIIQGKLEEAEEALKWWINIFGEDYYIELQRHRGLENIDQLGVSQEDVNQVLLSFAKKYNVKVIATNDSHYINEEDADNHDTLLCINTGKKKEDIERFKFSSNDFYFKTQKEMNSIFTDVPEAIDNTIEIADKIDMLDLSNDVALPKFPLPPGFNTQIEFLRHITFEGAKKRYPNISDEIKDRLTFELSVIEASGYPGYFLIVQDITTQARKMNVAVGPGRGSAAGSAVAYCLGITNIDPIKYNLLFERFLNPERISMPDIDMDFDDLGRSKIIDYVLEKYGKDQVAQIITYGTMAAKMSIRDVGRVLNVPLDDVNRISKQYPSHAKATLQAILAADGIDKELKSEMNAEDVDKANKIRALSENNDHIGEMLRVAKGLEGSVRNTGIHACGVVITPEAVTNYVPVTKSKDNGLLVTQFDNNVAESAGLLKMDFLGLRTLSIIKDCCENIEMRHGIKIDPDEIPLDDGPTYELFQQANTVGIFQYESAGMRKHLKDLKPTRFEDLIAMNALYRPGPLSYIPNFIKRKHGFEEIIYDLPEMEAILSETYGITVYQEQVMQLSQKLGGFSKGQADGLRKAMGKKKRALIDELYPIFMEGCIKNGHPKDVIDKIWKDWESFASYAFNKSHSTCYAFLAVQTAYLKANYPAEFMAAVLSNNKNDITKVNIFLREVRSMRLEVKAPSIIESQKNFSVNKKGEIVIGLSGLKGVGEGPVESIIDERNAHGPYVNLVDMTKRLNLRLVNKRCLEALAYAGALDEFKIHRSQYFAQSGSYASYLEHCLKYGQSYQKKKAEAVQSLFGNIEDEELYEPEPPQCEQWSDREEWEKEKEVIGIYVSGHPLDLYRVELDHYVTCELSMLEEIAAKGRRVSVAGIVQGARFGANARGNGNCRFTLQDYTGSYDFGLYRETFEQFKSLVTDGQVLFIEGVFNERYNSDELFFKVEQIRLLSTVGDEKTKSITLFFNSDHITAESIDSMQTMFKSFSGNHQLKFVIAAPEQDVNVSFKSEKVKVKADSHLLKVLDDHNIAYKLN
jgi:DNA polymerase-3 subunit alpha